MLILKIDFLKIDFFRPAHLYVLIVLLIDISGPAVLILKIDFFRRPLQDCKIASKIARLQDCKIPAS